MPAVLIDPARVDLTAFGCTATLAVTDSECLPDALRLLESFVDDFDLACSRFRPDSELVGLQLRAGSRTVVSPLLAGALRAALDAAAMTGGLVDPTIGRSLSAAGYDRDLAAVPSRTAAPTPVPAAGWRTVLLDDESATVTVPAGVELDLGSTGKAYAADVAASVLARHVGCGVLVSFGGDVAVSGRAPRGGWTVHVTERAPAAEPALVRPQAVTVESGGLATSSTLLRHWRRRGVTLHHILDPATGLPAPVVWRGVTVAAATCVDANAASTAAVILGHEAPGWLRDCGLPARLVRADGLVVHVGGWPAPTTERVGQ